MAVRPQRRALIAIVVTAVAALPVAALATSEPASAATEYLYPTPSGTWSLTGNGNGHGHGLSQYGALGAARKGLTAAQILGFYYQGTALKTLGASTVRVGLTSQGGDTVVQSSPGLTLTWGGISKALNTTTTTRWDLTPSGSGFMVRWSNGGAWQNSFSITTTSAYFTSKNGTVRRYLTGGSSVVYRGAVGGVRSGAGIVTVNRVDLDSYVRGVVPREMPSSWAAAAVQAQAVAARTYARYAVEHNAADSYDICDTSQCQVYGGAEYDNPSGARQYGEEPGSDSAVGATSRQVLIYHNATIFAQFSASDGGYTTDGGQPYLVAKADPYEASSGDPYLGWVRSVNQRTVANALGLTSLSRIAITQRDGHGEWGGRILAATVQGSTGGVAKSVSVSGFALADAMGLPQAWFTGPMAPTIGHLDSVRLSGLHNLVITGWVLDQNHPDQSARVHSYIDSAGNSSPADVSRPDVQRAYGTVTANLGFSLSRPISGGTHRVCVYTGSLTPGVADVLLGCSSVTVPVSPLGAVETVQRTAGSISSAGTYKLDGWTFDPDGNGTSSNRVHVYVDSTGYSFASTQPRPDIQTRYQLAGAGVGFSVTVPVPKGSHRICAYGINNVGSGANVLLGCRQSS